MTWFNNLNLQWKILGTIGAVCALMIAVGGLGMKTAGDLKKDLDTVGSDLLPSQRALAATQAQLLMAQGDMRSALLTDDQKVSEQFIAAAKQHVDEAAKSWEPYQHGDHIAEQKPQVAEFEKGFAGWRSAIDQAIAETAKKTPAGRTAATDILMTKAAPLATAMNTAITSLEASEAQEAAAALDEAHATFGNAMKLMIAMMAISTAAALGLGFNLARTIQRGVAEVRRVVTSMADNCATNLAGALGAMAGGDLTVTVTPVTTPILQYAQDEIGQTAIATNKLLDKVQASINGYAQAKTGLTDLVSQVQASANTLAATAEQVGSAAGQTGSAVNQVASSISQVASGAGQQAGDLDAAVNAVHELNTHAQAVGQMVALIEDIAERTDLLALNAAIESARAGEHGRGFAVVADEVRKLAEKATETVREIGTAIREMSSSSTRVNDATTSVAAVSGETAAAAEEIAATAEEMSAQVEETAAQAEELSTTAQELQMLVNRFKLEGRAEAGSHDRRPVPLRRAA